jgi:hypothetical protein
VAVPPKPPVSKSGRALILLAMMVFFLGIFASFVFPFPFGLLVTVAGAILLVIGLFVQRRDTTAWRRQQPSSPIPPVTSSYAKAKAPEPKVELSPQQMRTFRRIIAVGGIVAISVPTGLFLYLGWFAGRLFLPALTVIIMSGNVVAHLAKLYYQVELKKAKATAASGASASSDRVATNGPGVYWTAPTGAVVARPFRMATCKGCSCLYDASSGRCPSCGLTA